MLGSLIKLELSRLLNRWQLWVALLLMVTCFIQGYIAFRPFGLEIDPYHDNYFVAFSYAQGMGAESILAGVYPLIISLLAGDSLVRDKRSGFDRYILTRASYRKYIFAKLLSAAIMVALFVYIVEFIMFIGAMLAFPSTETVQAIEGSTPVYAEYIFLNYPYLFIFLITSNAVLYGIALAMLCNFFAAFTKNIYVVLVAPWILLFVLQMIFYNIELSDYAPLDLLGLYLSGGLIYQQSTLEIPLIFLSMIALLFLATYLTFTWSIKRGNGK
ncbi:hypothetical protein ACFSO0_02375 [Brevibacillus sp. GCM10020057]|uniref:hypothetical protein n=1 Tax=Brevibacillus sp. GCM10020057 TaxID=3317327 RepID=UPI003635F7A1